MLAVLALHRHQLHHDLQRIIPATRYNARFVLRMETELSLKATRESMALVATAHRIRLYQWSEKLPHQSGHTEGPPHPLRGSKHEP